MTGTNEKLKKGLLLLCDTDADIQKYIGKHIDEICTVLERYIAEIELFNPVYGLVSCRTHDELIIRHILDSLAPLGIIIREAIKIPAGEICHIADAGSGAGLPGIPLATAFQFFSENSFPAIQVTLIEKMERRADFLRSTSAVLSLKNIFVEQCEIKNTPRSSFDIITFRAFKPLTQKLLKELLPLLKDSGVLAAYKGRIEKINEELQQLEAAGLAVRDTLPCPVPFLEEQRHLVVIANFGKLAGNSYDYKRK
jgi:16S rRNA (guanine527-N7)-methyltransferase